MGNGMVSGIVIDPVAETIVLVPNLVPTKPPGFWGLPGGRVEENENPKEAMEREWLEEVGQEKIEISSRPAEIIRTGPSGPYIHHFFRVKAPKKGLKKDETPGEAGPPQRIPIKDITNGDIKVFPAHLRGIVMILEKMAKRNPEMGFIWLSLSRLLPPKGAEPKKT